MQTLPVFAVGCIEGGAAIFVDVASETLKLAEEFIQKNRPRMDIISTSPTDENIESDLTHIVRLRAAN